MFMKNVHDGEKLLQYQMILLVEGALKNNFH